MVVFLACGYEENWLIYVTKQNRITRLPESDVDALKLLGVLNIIYNIVDIYIYMYIYVVHLLVWIIKFPSLLCRSLHHLSI